MQTSKLPIRAISYNHPQLRSHIICAPITVDNWSRGVGKSTYHATRMAAIAFDMPRSKNIIEGRTYQQVLTKTLPGVTAALERLGYFEGVHYVFNKRPPANWPLCYEAPKIWDNTMAWITGAMFQIISQDRPGDARGLNADSITADEALTLDQGKLETGSFAANRANRGLYKTPLHHSIHLSTSRGFGSEFKWIEAFGKYYIDDGNDYRPVLNKIVGLGLKMIDSSNIEEQQLYWQEIIRLKAQVRWYVKTEKIKTPTGYKDKATIFYNEADVWDNILILGWEYVKNLRRTMTDLMFCVEILNKAFELVENCFYNITEAHLYEAINYEYLESLEYNMDKLSMNTDHCKKDADVKLDKPLHIGLDYGAYINAIVTKQNYDNTDWTLSSMYVKRPKLIQELIQNWCNYYRFHKTKDVVYWYDHTALPADGKSTTNYRDEVIKVLELNGWKVRHQYIGQAPHHHDKYLISSKTLEGKDPAYPRQMINKTNNKYLLLSMNQAPLKQGKRGFEKDKSSEWKMLNLREEATDLSDAWDVTNYGMNRDKGNSSGHNLGGIF